MSRPRFAIAIFFVAIATNSAVYADGFYTIIGPDGRPMIVPSKRVERNVNPSKVVTNPEIKATRPEQQVLSETSLKSKELPKVITKSSNTAPTAPTAPVLMTEKSNDSKPGKISKEKAEVIDQKSTLETSKEKTVITDSASQQRNEEKVKSNPDSSLSKQGVTSSATTSKKDETKYTTIDGVEYVNNEYLENQEFNLEGKKRFYIMPDGLGRTESIERKKGVSQSILDNVLNRSREDQISPVVLAPTYLRLSQQELANTFENDLCFIKGYNKSIKKLSQNKEVGLWPRKPLKEKFEYEVVKLDSSIKNIQVASYATTNDKPVYYWPLAVFLDEKGCVLEGASGFKSKSYPATILQHASILGVLQVPERTHYIMLTPLSSAVDMPDQELSNQGQIKISVLR
ncbi:putative pilus assembly protein FilE [Acinetobacter lactucae]|uniref:Pilus assembly protein FilE n=1 Tax=Acinetobacter lactucae TaxID=1785128 RepID=A0ABS1AKN7_9GAMM|nr:putative pilus assembly protein FilE [Acinetobacter lactucae]MBJ8438484.1 putative pilus assembly protein FilE [Acinetobacter lactucae]